MVHSEIVCVCVAIYHFFREPVLPLVSLSFYLSGFHPFVTTNADSCAARQPDVTILPKTTSGIARDTFNMTVIGEYPFLPPSRHSCNIPPPSDPSVRIHSLQLIVAHPAVLHILCCCLILVRLSPQR